MLLLAAQPRSIFIGQSVAYEGTSMFRDLEGVPPEQRIEFPVAEELQLGVASGLALQGFLPICIFPRMDFMLRAMDQLVNHLDKMEEMSHQQFDPKVIIRTRIGSKTPLDAGPQHTQNYVLAFEDMLTNIHVTFIEHADTIMDSYQFAIDSSRSVLIVESCF